MRLIDADKLNIYDVSPTDGFVVMGVTEEDIALAPSIDICFCKECKYKPICSHSVQHTTHEPTSVTIGYKSVEWCSYGCREEERYVETD